MPKIRTVTGGRFTHVFFCPACECGHAINTDKTKKNTPIWDYNEDPEKPTIRPSIRSKSGDSICHSFVVDGKIKFLDDCTHELKGQTVDLEDF